MGPSWPNLILNYISYFVDNKDVILTVYQLKGKLERYIKFVHKNAHNSNSLQTSHS